MNTLENPFLEVNAPRIPDLAAKIAHYRTQYSTGDLLVLALGMLDNAAKEQRGKKRWLTNNLTLEVIRDHVNSL